MLLCFFGGSFVVYVLIYVTLVAYSLCSVSLYSFYMYVLAFPQFVYSSLLFCAASLPPSAAPGFWLVCPLSRNHFSFTHSLLVSLSCHNCLCFCFVAFTFDCYKLFHILFSIKSPTSHLNWSAFWFQTSLKPWQRIQ